MENSVKQQVVKLEKLYKDVDWKRFGGKAVIPIGAETETHNLVGVLEEGFNFLLGGRTGSGKSNFFHCAIVSLLKKTSTKDLEFILIDPKRVELMAYKNLPNLLYPVIERTEDARKALDWCVHEIDRRLDLFSKEGNLSFETYNREPSNKLSRILIVIDECSDLLAQDHEFFEQAISYIATAGRFAGMNILIGTSRPSPEDIYTKKIVDSFLYRIAFQTVRAEDSVAILGVAGAEKLQGNGDLLLLYPEITVPVRAQGFYVSEDEIKKATDDVENQTEEFKPKSITVKLLWKFFPGFVIFLSTILRKIKEKKGKGKNIRYHF